MNPSISFKITHKTTNPSSYEASFKGPALKIGTVASSHIRLSDEDGRISRMHAVIDLVETVQIIDLGSAHGIRVDGVKVSKAPLQVGTVISIGLYELEVLAIENAKDEEEPEVPPVPQPDGLTDEDIAKAKTSVLISTAALLVAGNSLVHGRDLKRVVRVDCLGRVNAEIDRRLPWPSPAEPRPQGDIDDHLMHTAAELEVRARAFAFFKDDDKDIGTVRAELRKAAVAYAKAEQGFGAAVARALRGEPG